LAFTHMQVVPQGEHNRAAVACDPIEPSTDRVFVHLDDPRRGPQRIAFCPCTHCHLEERSVGLQAVVRCPIAQGDTPPTCIATSLRFTVTAPILHHQPCCEGLPIAATVPVRAV